MFWEVEYDHFPHRQVLYKTQVSSLNTDWCSKNFHLMKVEHLDSLFNAPTWKSEHNRYGWYAYKYSHLFREFVVVFERNLTPLWLYAWLVFHQVKTIGWCWSDWYCIINQIFLQCDLGNMCFVVIHKYIYPLLCSWGSVHVQDHGTFPNAVNVGPSAILFLCSFPIEQLIILLQTVFCRHTFVHMYVDTTTILMRWN